jgi:hypothetical protein
MTHLYSHFAAGSSACTIGVWKTLRRTKMVMMTSRTASLPTRVWGQRWPHGTTKVITHPNSRV